jgi:hypothetical protein
LTVPAALSVVERLGGAATPPDRVFGAGAGVTGYRG